MYQKCVRHRALFLYFAPSLCGLVALLLLMLLSDNASHPIKITIIVVFLVASLGAAIATVVHKLRQHQPLVLQQEGQEEVDFEDSGSGTFEWVNARSLSSSSSSLSSSSLDDDD